VTFYVDASVPVAVRRALAHVRDDVLYAGGPDAPAEDTDDKDWLPEAGREDWVVLLRDKRIRKRPGERQAFLDAGVRLFCMTGGGNYTRWETLRLLTARWPRIEGVASARTGPYIYSVTWEGVRELSLGGVKTA
jgi:PIN like domain